MQEHLEDTHLKGALGKIETQLDHISKQLDVIHARIDDREVEIKSVEALVREAETLGRENASRISALESESSTHKWWIGIGVVVAIGVATVISQLL